MPDICSEMMLLALSRFNDAAESAEEYASLACERIESSAATPATPVATMARTESDVFISSLSVGEELSGWRTTDILKSTLKSKMWQ